MSDKNEIISQNVVNSLPVGVLIVDQTGSIVTVNPAAASILGFSQAELLGRGWGELFFENDDNYLFNQVFVDVIQKELVGLRREVPYVTPDSEKLTLSITSSYLQDDATLVGVVVILHDITELSRMQQRENEILKEINRVQEDKIRCLSKLASSVAHQIRNPAFTIGGFAARLSHLLRAHGIESDYPDIILEEARRLETIVKTVGRFAALSRLRLERKGLAAIVADARHQAEDRARSLGRFVNWGIALPEVELVGDGELLASALGELLRNSVEFATQEQVDIRVDANLANDHVHLSVADNGPGIAPRDRLHIFDPFYSSRPDGAGMGLALAQEILLEHNGAISLDRQYADGARFNLIIPRFPRHLVSQVEGEAVS